MKLIQYNLIQIHFINLYAKHLHISREKAVVKWMRTGLAEKFAGLYRNR